jgi:hypothetical protein
MQHTGAVYILERTQYLIQKVLCVLISQLLSAVDNTVQILFYSVCDSSSYSSTVCCTSQQQSTDGCSYKVITSSMQCLMLCA